MSNDRCEQAAYYGKGGQPEPQMSEHYGHAENGDDAPEEEQEGGGGVLKTVGLPVVVIAVLAFLWRWYRRSRKALPAPRP